MSDFMEKPERFYFWDEMWNDSLNKNDEKVITKNSVEDPPMESEN